jgi:hypothetical protein
MIRASIGCLVIGVVLTYFSVKEWRLSRASSASPEEITLKALIARGPRGNPNIILTEFVPCPNIVYQSYQTGKHGDNWTKVWVPILPEDEGIAQIKQGPNTITNFQAIIVSTNAKNELELGRRLDQPKLRSMVMNELHSLGSEEKKLLAQSYPNTDFSKCLIIEEGREPAGSVSVFLLTAGSGMAGLAGTILLVLGVAWKKW